MKNNLLRSEQDANGKWWYIQPGGTRQTAKVSVCKTCSTEFLTYPNSVTSYCSLECRRHICRTCDTEFVPATNRQIYCSEKCKPVNQPEICTNCKKEFTPSKNSARKFCSTKCGYDFLCPVGSVIKDSSGYTITKVPEGTAGAKLAGRGRRNWMWTHRYVMQQILGRPLNKNENVHHINGIRDDNRPENLELWKKSQPCGVRSKDYHCAGCRCHEL